MKLFGTGTAQAGKRKLGIPPHLLAEGAILTALCVVLLVIVVKLYTLPEDVLPGVDAFLQNQSGGADAQFTPVCTAQTNPANLIASAEVLLNGELCETYQAAEPITFGTGDTYTDMAGIVAFRGNNFRSGAAYGTAALTEKKFGQKWTVSSSSLQAPDGEVWTGSGWTGQPLIVTWPKATRQVMNLKDWAKTQETLTEVVYATMDGHVYFLELETGKATRDPLFLGFTFKGAGALDPRGYPILYVGAGYNSAKGTGRAMAVSLIDGSVLYEFGANDGFALRAWSMYDASPLVDAETDQLIYPGENGVLYIVKLNTQYDETAGTLTMSPDEPVRWRYSGTRTGQQYWVGMEASPVIWREHLIIGDNGGNLMCLNLNTLQLVWVQDVLDDTNCTPVLELEDGHPYVYVSTSFHAGWRAAENATATIPVWKIDAVNGEIVWQTDYTCYTQSGVSGGVQGTIALGKNKLSNLIFVPVARTGSNASAGKLVALDKQTGAMVWEFPTAVYSWSSPVDFYDAEGNGYLIYCTSGGYMYLLDGATGEKLDAIDLNGNIEASAAVFNNTVVVGHRSQKIFGIALT